MFFLTLVALTIQLLYWVKLFTPLSRYLEKALPSFLQVEWPPVSVIICARNEERNLRKNLHLILEQDYPRFEVVVVDDGSTDGSALLLEVLADAYPHLRIISSTAVTPGKKQALIRGMVYAQHDQLLVTDADCRPMGNEWIKSMVAGADPQHLILGYSPYAPEPGLLNFLIRFETVTTAIQYGSYALAGMPYMGVGRNMGYHRKAVNSNPYVEEDYKIASGDDDLLVKNLKNISPLVRFLPQAQMISDAKSNWKEWIKQKSRHISTAPLYRLEHKWKLTLYAFSLTLFYYGVLLLTIQEKSIAFLLLTIQMAMCYPVWKKITSSLGDEHLESMPLFLAGQVFMGIVYYPLLALLLIANRRSGW